MKSSNARNAQVPVLINLVGPVRYPGDIDLSARGGTTTSIRIKAVPSTVRVYAKKDNPVAKRVQYESGGATHETPVV